MGFLDEVDAEQSARSRPQTICRIARWKSGQPEDVVTGFEAAMAAVDKYTATAIVKVVQNYPTPNVEVTLSTVQRHRRKECECYRGERS